MFNNVQNSANRGFLKYQSKRGCFGPGVSNMARDSITKGNGIKTQNTNFGAKVFSRHFPVEFEITL